MEILAMKPMSHVLPQLQALPRASYFHWRLSIQSDMEEGKTKHNFVYITGTLSSESPISSENLKDFATQPYSSCVELSLF